MTTTARYGGMKAWWYVEKEDWRAKSGSARAAEVRKNSDRSSKSSALYANLFDHGLGSLLR